MNLWPRLSALLLAVVAAGCGAKSTGHSVSVNPFAPPPAEVVAPPPPIVAEAGPCPYLAESVVEQAGGEPVAAVRRSIAGPYQGCSFMGPDGSEQLSVFLWVGDPATADAIVSRDAPVGLSEPVGLHGGWHGGSYRSEQGGTFAVGRAGVAVSVFSAQPRLEIAKRLVRSVINDVG